MKQNVPISVCVLTFNSEKTIQKCIENLLKIADELIVIDSGSTDQTFSILNEFNITPTYNPYVSHSDQMNFALTKTTNQWVLCMDSDEIIDELTINNINNLKSSLINPHKAYRISRYWYILDGIKVRAIYPVSSPDYPVRLFHKDYVKFNGEPVDDKPTGFDETTIIKGHVYHDTFYSLHELFNKLNSYTTRITKLKDIEPSLLKAFLNPIPAFIKWYFIKGSYKDGVAGFVCGLYASLYTFLKYFKSWYIVKTKTIKAK